jgi:hypothetical protein
MESMHKFEKQIEEWLRPLPHLPTDWRKWLANNVWWIVLVGVILSVIGVLIIAGALLTAFALIGTVTTVYGVNVVNQSYSSWWYVASVVSLLFLIATLVIEAMAISPLKSQKKKGWDLLFITFLLGIASSIVSVFLGLFTGSMFSSLLGGIVGAVISAYFLFEIRSYFK